MKKKFRKKNFFCCSNFTPFLSKKVQIRDHFFSLLLPMDFCYKKSLNIELQEVGAKGPLNGVTKWETNLVKKTFFAASILHYFWAKKFKSETTSFHYFSSRIPNIIKVWTLNFRKLGQKDHLTQWTKCDGLTNTRYKNKKEIAKSFVKNIAYGRQSISRPMRIVALIPQYGGPRIPKNHKFFKNGENHLKRKNSKTFRNMPNLAIRPSTRGL